MKPAERWSSEEDYKLPADIQQKFYEKVIALAEKMFGRDCDGDLPIDIQIIDRTRWEPNNYMSLPYREENNMGARMHVIMANIDMANSALQREYQVQLIRKDYEKQKLNLGKA